MLASSARSMNDEPNPNLEDEGVGTPLLTPLGTHEAHYHIDIKETIYAAVVYAPSVSRLTTGRGINKATVIVFAMIFLNMILQLGLLRVMDIFGNRDALAARVFVTRQESEELHLHDKIYQHFLTRDERKIVEEGIAKDPPCILDKNGTFSCTPPSIHFASEWDALDVNKDGVWTISEAQGGNQSYTSAKHEAKGEAESKRRTVLFNTIIRGLKQRAEWLVQINGTVNATRLYLSQDVLATRAIPKAYFEYWAGDAMMCTRWESLGCESIVASGLFDAALKHGRSAAAHKGIFDYGSATRYCRMMLTSQGGCEQSLPASLKAAVIERKNQCGEVSVENNGVVSNPYNSVEVMPVTDVSYAHLDAQLEALRPIFLFFSVLIIFLFFASLVDECRELIKKADFLLTFPSTYNSEDRGGEDLGPEKEKDGRYRIDRLAPGHRVALVCVFLLRCAIVFMVVYYGTRYLLAEVHYMELVLNAVALSFITSIDEMIYEVFMETKVKNEIGFDDAQRIKYKGHIPRDDGSFAGYSFRKDCWGLSLIPLVSILIVLSWSYFMRRPAIEALFCSCLQEGPHCAESMVNQEAWWQQYWAHRLPSAIHHIEAMRLQGA